jgi:hypothetical protein
MDRVDYSQVDYLASSPNPEIGRLSMMVKDLRERVQSLEEGQTQLLDKLNSMQKKGSKGADHSTTARSRTRKKFSKYACDLCLAKFSHPAMLQKHRKQAHKAPYNI